MTCAKRQKLFRENKSSQLQRRKWWSRIKKDEPQDAKHYAEAMGKSFEELDAYYPVSTWHTSWSASLHAGPAHWQADLTCHGDIHPHPGPRTQEVSAWSCNVACGSGAWFESSLSRMIVWHLRLSNLALLVVADVCHRREEGTWNLSRFDPIHQCRCQEPIDHLTGLFASVW